MSDGYRQFVMTYGEDDGYDLWKFDGEGAYEIVQRGMDEVAWLHLRNGGVLLLPVPEPTESGEKE